ncbi:MAG TPA: di-heme-cytochrome C peroxidase [Candidatus Binatia bacterium]
MQFLPQNWDAATREQFWFTSQGSRVIPYAWFLALEQDDGSPFRSDAHMDALRYIPAPKSLHNPDALPVGFVKDVDGKDAWIGLTCAACHTGRIDYRGTPLIIDGAPTLANADRLLTELSAALSKTLEDPVRLERFVARVLPRNPGRNDRTKLIEQMRAESKILADRVRVNAVPWKDYPGFGRIDAYGQVYNQVTELDLGVPGNGKRPDAPASYPFLWGIAQSDLVQWNGAGQNRFPSEYFPMGILFRNTVEIIGVYGRLDMREARGLYPSSVDVMGLGRLENPLCTLHAPPWPREVFGPLDENLRAKGEKIYDHRCAKCHGVVENGTKYTVGLVPIAEVKTDPNLAVNAHDRRAKTGGLAGRAKNLKETFGPEDNASDILVHAVTGVLLAKPLDTFVAVHQSACVADASNDLPPDQKIREVQKALDELREQLAVVPVKYKPRPLNGIWATAPYLHNGSVPTLADLLDPDHRPKSFYVGSREFDPVKVGFRSDESPGATKFDTTIDGNHNTGHLYGAGLSDTERRQLLEYLKGL